ncbi:MAG TPA: ABC transporter permease, partial [Bacteroidia bacterium]|nr:ABC transporter permease [Bacteroidia bacterium]
ERERNYFTTFSGLKSMSFLTENIKISLGTIRAQLLRTVITVLIITFGIMSLVGTLTSIDAFQSSISSSFTSMGANTFTIRNKDMNFGDNGRGTKAFKSITYNEAQRFKKEFDFPAITSVSSIATRNATVKFQSKKTNPNIFIRGSDENYMAASGMDLDKGRNFTNQEVQSGGSVAIVGKDVVEALFTENDDPIDKVISIGGAKYRIIGVLKSKGSGIGFSNDKLAILTLNNVRQNFSTSNMPVSISVVCHNPQLIDIAFEEARNLFRIIRKLSVKTENDFDVVKSDSLAAMFLDYTSVVTIGATIIGIITLLGAAIGLMNIMLVSVSERTREIGIRKAIGANKKVIRRQFLVEALVICQMGGILGTILGIIIGNLVAFLLGTHFIIPWLWIIMGIILCFIVGVASGIYPAIKASNLDPIEALRFE